MADEKYYAWTRFESRRDNQSIAREYIEPGDEVSATKLKLTEGQFQELIDAGSVRTRPYPVPDNVTGVSPVEHVRREALRLADEASAEAWGDGTFLADSTDVDYEAQVKATEAANKAAAKG